MVIKSEFRQYQYCLSNDAVDIEEDQFELIITNEKHVRILKLESTFEHLKYY